MNRIFTLGTDSRSEEDFIEILLSYNIDAVIDVRSIPKSKITIFNRANLEELLGQERIDYHFLGSELGGFRKGGYIAYTITKEFSLGVEKLESIAKGKQSVFICAERFPWKCHRKWIARELHQRGWIVEHIIDKGKVWVPK
ncbi:MAG TPA: DUF488 domain-containing protein [Thermodesulfovibrionales bacterium]|nr:DUF488 domain-containing protein [Thermodesulfovibrionales bacterium]